MECFLEVANCLSFSAAAQNMHISQQAVTKQISLLEEELGFRLFYRTTRKVELTPAGISLRSDFTSIHRQISDSIKRARLHASSGEDILRLGFLSSLSRRDIILPISDYIINEYPDTKLDIELLDFLQLRNHLIDGRLDVCITTSNDWKLWPGTHTTVLRKKQFQIVYSKKHPLSKLKDFDTDKLSEYTQLVLPNDNVLDGLSRWGRKIPCKNIFHCPDISTLMVHLELGEGFALLTKVIEGHDAPELCYKDVPFPEAHAEIVCISPETLPDKIKEIIKQIKAHDPILL